MNQLKKRSNTSGFKGVYWDDRARKWAAQVSPGGKTIYLGLYQTAEDAAGVYDKAAA